MDSNNVTLYQLCVNPNINSFDNLNYIAYNETVVVRSFSNPLEEGSYISIESTYSTVLLRVKYSYLSNTYNNTKYFSAVCNFINEFDNDDVIDINWIIMSNGNHKVLSFETPVVSSKSYEYPGRGQFATPLRKSAYKTSRKRVYEDMPFKTISEYLVNSISTKKPCDECVKYNETGVLNYVVKFNVPVIELTKNGLYVDMDVDFVFEDTFKSSDDVMSLTESLYSEDFHENIQSIKSYCAHPIY